MGQFEDAVRSVLANPMDLPAEFLDYVGTQYPSQNQLAIAKASGQRIALGTFGSNVTTSGLTFGAGADVLATALEFTATGSNNYIVRLFAPQWANSTSGDGCQLRLNLDSADGGGMGLFQSTANNAYTSCVGAGFVTRPAAGEHSVNVRLVAVTGGTATITAGAGSPLQGIVTIEVA